jgi:hypothetical protein
MRAISCCDGQWGNFLNFQVEDLNQSFFEYFGFMCR